MKSWTILRRIVHLTAALGLLLAAFAQPALAVPPMPSDFWGYVTIDGSPAPAGTVVRATVNGVSFQATASNSGGQALYLLSVNGDDLSTAPVEGGTENQAITFQVGGTAVAQTGVWRSGSNVQLNLARTSVPATISSVSPSSAARGSSVAVTIVGSNSNFTAGVTQVSFGAGVTVNSVSVANKTQLTANITIQAAAATGNRTVTVTTGAEVASKSNAFNVLAASLDVFLPANISNAVGALVSIPITIPADATGSAIIAYNFRVTANPAVLQFEGVDKASTLSSGWTVEEQHDTPGEISVLAYGTTNLGSNGVLLKLLGRGTGSNGASTPLQFASFTFNEGLPVATPRDGLFTSTGLGIVGAVTYITGTRPVAGTVLTISGGAATTVTTGSDGRYRVAVTAGKSYTVTPGSGRYSGPAITALDAAYVAQCLLGRRPMSECSTNAANVSNTGGVSAFDASLIARYAVGLTSPTSQVGNWLYSPARRTYSNVQTSQLNQGYQAYLRGDVTGNWGQPAVATAAASIAARLIAPAAAVDGQLLVPLRMETAAPGETIAYQFELRYDPAMLQLATVDLQETLSSGWEVVWNEVEPGHVLAAGFSADPLQGEGDLLRLSFNSTTDDIAAALAGLNVSPISLNEDAALIEVTVDYGELQGERLYLPVVGTEP